MLQKRNTPETARAKPATFVWDDPFLLDEQLTDEERMIRDAARDYCQDRLARAGAGGEPARDLRPGDHGARWARSACSGRRSRRSSAAPASGYVAYGLVAREVERVNSGYRSAMSVQSSLVMHPIFAYGTDEQRAKYLPKLARAASGSAASG